MAKVGGEGLSIYCILWPIIEDLLIEMKRYASSTAEEKSLHNIWEWYCSSF